MKFVLGELDFYNMPFRISAEKCPNYSFWEYSGQVDCYTYTILISNGKFNIAHTRNTTETFKKTLLIKWVKDCYIL